MHFETYNFRNALAILDSRPEWEELKKIIGAMTRQDVIDSQNTLTAARRSRTPRKGAQSAINRLFKERLPTSSWEAESVLFDSSAPDDPRQMPKWAVDFVRRGEPAIGSREADFGLGVEVAFNHAEALAWTLVRLDLGSENTIVRPEARIDVGVTIMASESLKTWGRMDSTVGTFEQAQLWLELMRPVIPIPIALVGLYPNDSAQDVRDSTDVFPGTGSGNRS